MLEVNAINIFEFNDQREVKIFCDNDNEALELLEYLESEGFTWLSGHLPTAWSGCLFFRDSNSYNVEMMRKKIGYGEREGSLSFKEFCEYTSNEENECFDSEELLQFLGGLSCV